MSLSVCGERLWRIHGMNGGITADTQIYEVKYALTSSHMAKHSCLKLMVAIATQNGMIKHSMVFAA